jgi:hypothetical protein
VAIIRRLTQHRHDLVHRRRIGRVAHPLVARRASEVVPGIVTGERRRPAASSSTVMGTSSIERQVSPPPYQPGRARKPARE